MMFYIMRQYVKSDLSLFSIVFYSVTIERTELRFFSLYCTSYVSIGHVGHSRGFPIIRCVVYL